MKKNRFKFFFKKNKMLPHTCTRTMHGTTDTIAVGSVHNDCIERSQLGAQ